MAGVSLDNGVAYDANALADAMNAEGMSLALFKSNITPAVTDVDATYLGAGVEADFPGYARIVLDSWGPAAVLAHIAIIVETLRLFTCTGASGNNIYGYFIVKGTQVFFAERDPAAPVPITTAGQVYAVVPRVKVHNG